MKKKIIILLAVVVIIIIGLIGINKISQIFIEISSIYKITYNDGVDGGTRVYCFYIDDNYQIHANETMYGSTLNSTPEKKNYEINLSENNKKYLKNILDNITEYKEDTEEKKGSIDFIVTNKRNNKNYLIEYGSNEYITFKYILVYGVELDQLLN